MNVVRCPRCGSYYYPRLAVDLINQYSDRDKSRLAGVLRHMHEMNALGEPVLLNPASIPVLLSQAPQPFDVAAKARNLLIAIARKSKFAGDWVTINDLDCRPLAYADTVHEFIYLCRYITDRSWANKVEGTSTVYPDPDNPETVWTNQPEQPVFFCLTPEGWEVAQSRPRIESSKAFVAMWFSPEVQSAYDQGIKAAIEDDCGFRSVRIDNEHYNGDIVDRVLAEINESRFVVVDLTGHRNGVYFEAGYALGRGTPVIWTCRDGEAPDTHFDAEHFNQIRWTDPADLRNKLQTRIRATIGRGSLAPAS